MTRKETVAPVATNVNATSETPVIALVPPTYEEVLAAAQKKNREAALKVAGLITDEGATDILIIEAQNESFRASQELKKVINEHKAEEEKQKAQKAREARKAILDEYDATDVTPERKAELKAVIYDALERTTEAIPKHEIHLKEGTTGAQLERGAKAKDIIDQFKANRVKGLSDTDNAKAIIANGHARGTTHAVILAYRKEIGEITA